jgi:kumamolisin
MCAKEGMFMNRFSVTVALLASAIPAAAGASNLRPSPTPPGNPVDVLSGAQVIDRGGHSVVIPSSSQNIDDNSASAHSNVRFIIPHASSVPAAAPGFTPAALRPTASAGLPPYLGMAYETPASLACLHGLTSQVNGCNPNVVTAAASGGKGVIAIVDAYHYPNALADLQSFSAQFGLTMPTAATFQVVYASGAQPAVNSGWQMEASLDIEYSHALAPAATIVLVEAASPSYADLMKAVQVAGQIVSKAGGGQVSMSWGSGEFSAQTSYDSYFTAPKVVYFASSGDTPGVSYPSTSPNVVAVGGVSVSRALADLKFLHFASWSEAGAGVSAVTQRPAYQAGFASTIGTMRAVPDIALLANPETGAWIYNQSLGGWGIVGGTSLAAPLAASMANIAGSFAASTQAELTKIYAAKAANSASLVNPATGYCGLHTAYQVAPTWNFCTGAGIPFGKAAL